MVRRVIKRRSVANEGAGNTAPSAPKSGGIKRRSEALPIAPPEVPDFGGELGQMINKITDSGEYGSPFIRASSPRLNMRRNRTGTLALDLCLGGGWTAGRAGMLYGEKSSGKSTTALQSIATMQRDNPDAIAAWVDIEGTFDKSWAKKLGVDLERLVIVEPETGEHAVDLADSLLRAREVHAVVTDSIAMLVPMKELEESVEKETMALQARLVGKYIRKTNNALLRERSRDHWPMLIHINQIRMKVGLIFGDPRTLPGGKALEFSTSQQVETKNKEHAGTGDLNNTIVFNEHNFKITKNKAGGPMREGAYKLIRLKGYEGMPEGWIDQAKTFYRFGTQVGVVTGSAQSFEIEGVRGKFKGAPAFNKWAMENPVEYHAAQAMVVAGFRKLWDLDA